MLSFHQPYHTKVYIYGGELEGSDMVKRINLFKIAMKRWEESKSIEFDIRTSIHPEGKHQEFYWSQEFPRALEWLFFDKLENPKERKKNTIKPNKMSEAVQHIYIYSEDSWKDNQHLFPDSLQTFFFREKKREFCYCFKQ